VRREAARRAARVSYQGSTAIESTDAVRRGGEPLRILSKALLKYTCVHLGIRLNATFLRCYAPKGAYWRILGSG
jgi:hypothetical protein